MTEAQEAMLRASQRALVALSERLEINKQMLRDRFVKTGPHTHEGATVVMINGKPVGT